LNPLWYRTQIFSCGIGWESVISEFSETPPGRVSRAGSGNSFPDSSRNFQISPKDNSGFAFRLQNR
jgi:hypothetical protein